MPCWACGLYPLEINHTTIGGVAPVNKTTSYGTVTNIPGEPTKCWITKNLGATQQATAVNDATEASAGWYWQFNHKQGYKHDGTNRTPNSTWIATVSENTNWQSVNDPCKLELGSAWRLPTYAEWFNVDNVGGWYDWNGPWGSALKLHAAGDLYCNTGVLEYRGVIGYSWTSTQSSSYYGWFLNFYNQSSSININNVKAYGMSARCLRDI
jgi:hypothetical protein